MPLEADKIGNHFQSPWTLHYAPNNKVCLWAPRLHLLSYLAGGRERVFSRGARARASPCESTERCVRLFQFSTSPKEDSAPRARARAYFSATPCSERVPRDSTGGRSNWNRAFILLRTHTYTRTHAPTSTRAAAKSKRTTGSTERGS